MSGGNIQTEIFAINFVLYGPLDEAYSVFPAISMIHAMVAYYAQGAFRVKLESEDHPMHKVIEK
jgi:tetrahydromethanopterin S-methyltransferase subunit H